MPKSKIKIRIVSLTSCDGCQLEFLNLGERLIKLLENDIDIADFRLAKGFSKKSDRFDITFIEGAPVTKNERKLLKEARKRTKTLVAIGACACIGGVTELKNYCDKYDAVSYVYKKEKNYENADVKPVKALVKVDFELPGCPLNREELYSFIKANISGKKFEIKQQPVCVECQKNGNKCLLKEGIACLGSVTLGGCDALCLGLRYGCIGCRGLHKFASYENIKKRLEDILSPEEIDEALQLLGNLDDILMVCSGR